MSKKENIKIQWDAPLNSDGSVYEHIREYELHHNIPGFSTPMVVPPGVTSGGPVELDKGKYQVAVQTVNTEGHRSAKVITKFEVANPPKREVKRGYGVALGGVISTNNFITSSGVFKTEDQSGWSFAGAGAPQTLNSFTAGNANRYSQDCDSIASLNFSSMGAEEQGIKSHYILFDASDSNDPFKLIKYEDNVFSTSNNLNIGYFYDTDDGDATGESTFVAKSGTASVTAGSSDVVGNGTSFTSQYAVDDIIYFNSSQAGIVTYIESDTSLIIDRNFTTAISNSNIKKQGLSIDKDFDAVIYSVRNDSGTFKITPIELIIDENIFTRSRLATIQAAPQLLNFNSTPTLTTTYSNLVLTATAAGYKSPKFKITGSGFSNSEISQTADSSFQNPTSGNTYTKTLDKVDTFSTTDLEFTITITEAADESNTSLQTTQTVTVFFMKDGDNSSAAAKKTLTGLFYYRGNNGISGTAPSIDNSPQMSYNFSTGDFDFEDNGSNWSFSPPTYAAGNANKYWYQYFRVEETTAGGNTGLVVLEGNVTQGFGFSGIVTFTGSQLTDGSTTSNFGTSNFDGAYNTLTGKPNLFDGAYGSLSGTPTIPTAVSQLSNDSNFLGSGANISVLNNNSGYVIPTGVAQAVNNNTTTINGSKLTTGTVSAANIEANSVLSNLVYVGNALITNTSGKIYSAGKTDFSDTTGGFFLGYTGGAYKFDVGDSSKYLRWNGSNLDIKGNITLDNASSINISGFNNNSGFTNNDVANTKTTASEAATAANSAAKTLGTVGGWTIDSSAIFSGTKDTTGYTTGGITFNSGGSIHAKEFYIDTSGNANFKGDITGASGTFSGSVQVGSTTLSETNTLNENTTKANIGLSNINNPASAVTPIAAGDVNTNVTNIAGGVIQTGFINAARIQAGTITGEKIESGNNALGSTSNKFAFNGATEYGGTYTTVIGATATSSDKFAGLFFGSGNTTPLGVQTSGSGVHAFIAANSASIGETSSYRNRASLASSTAGSRFEDDGGNWCELATPSYAVYYYGTAASAGPFTGCHDALLADSETCVAGDILVDTGVAYAKSVSDVITNVTRSTSTNQKAVVGVFVTEIPDHIPAALAKTVESDLKSTRIIDPDHASIVENKTIIAMNSLGEGQVNVCGENGNIEIGDLIVSSSTTGKGMKQDDDIIRSCTVGKAREAVTFASASTVKQIACIYLCG